MEIKTLLSRDKYKATVGIDGTVHHKISSCYKQHEVNRRDNVWNSPKINTGY